MFLRGLLTFALMLGLVGLTDAADGAKKAKKKGSGTFTAVVKSVDANKDKPETGSLTVQPVEGKAKKGTPATLGAEKKLTINTETRIDKLDAPAKAKKGTPLPAGQPAKLADLGASKNVLITLKAGDSNVAERVSLVPAKKAKKKMKANQEE